MILPLGHDEQVARRWPWVTTLIVVLNLLLWLGLRGPMQEGVHQYLESRQAAAAFAAEHSEIAPCEFLTSDEIAAAPIAGELQRPGIPPPTAGFDTASQQQTMDELCVNVQRARAESILHRYGYIPGENNWSGLLTYQFLHGGLLHLAFNLWFLWLAGAIVEDAWGRVAYPAFYLCAGVAGALAHKAAAPGALLPLIGASGAVAGAMGAFLVRHATTRIRVLTWVLIRPRVYSLPAYFLLPLWGLGELCWALLLPPEKGGTAYWAHVGGFVFGVGFAGALRWSGVEQRLDDAIEGRDAKTADPRITAAIRMLEAGHGHEPGSKARRALSDLQELAREDPFSVDVQLALVQAAHTLKDDDLSARTRARLVELYQRLGEHETACELHAELTREGRAGQLSPRARLRAAEYLGSHGREAAALAELPDLYAAGFVSSEAAEALVAHAELLLRLKHREQALELFEAAERELSGHPRLSARIQLGRAAAQHLDLEQGQLGVVLSSVRPSQQAFEGNQYSPPSAPPSAGAPSAVAPVAPSHEHSDALTRDLPAPSKRPG